MTSGCMVQVYIYLAVESDLLSGIFGFEVCAKENVALVSTNKRMISFFIFFVLYVEYVITIFLYNDNNQEVYYKHPLKHLWNLCHDLGH